MHFPLSRSWAFPEIRIRSLLSTVHYKSYQSTHRTLWFWYVYYNNGYIKRLSIKQSNTDRKLKHIPDHISSCMGCCMSPNGLWFYLCFRVIRLQNPHYLPTYFHILLVCWCSTSSFPASYFLVGHIDVMFLHSNYRLYISVCSESLLDDGHMKRVTLVFLFQARCKVLWD